VVPLVKNIRHAVKTDKQPLIRVIKEHFYQKISCLRGGAGEQSTKNVLSINGAKLPDITGNDELFRPFLLWVFNDTFLVSCHYHDNYDTRTIARIAPYMNEGPYGYKDGAFDVTVHSGDIVVDAGAWIGDFSAYAASKRARVYAFEPVEDTYRLLCNTAELNAGIFPVKSGLGSDDESVPFYIDTSNSGSNSILPFDGGERASEEIHITTLDRFVTDNNISRVDFIKADIEGAERAMLRGAADTIKRFSPKLAICTYHLPDDKEVLEKIIMSINPNYRVIHLKCKLFACVIEKT